MSVSVDKIAEKTFDSFKRITPALVAISLLTGMLLFLPESILEKMSLNNLPELWNRVIGIVFLLSIALILTILVSSVYSNVTSRRRAKKIKENLKKKYMSLSSSQKKIIKTLLKSNDKTIALDQNSGDTIYLVNSLFLHMPQQIVSVGWDNEMVLKYTPQPWLLELYNEEPEFFK